jgi:cytochrome P450
MFKTDKKFMFWKKKPKKDDENNPQQMGMLQRLAMKKVMSMDPKEREKLMQKALTPENIAKNKDKILETMEQMKASGQMTDEQMRIAKEKLGL